MFLFRSAPKTDTAHVQGKSEFASERDRQEQEHEAEDEDYEDEGYEEEYEEEEYEEEEEEYEAFEEEHYEDEEGDDGEEYYEEYYEEVIEDDEEADAADDDRQSDHTPVTSNTRGSIAVEEAEGAQQDDQLAPEEGPASPKSFADRSSILLLAAEHDRVDIIKSMLAEDQQEDILQSWLRQPPPSGEDGGAATPDVVELLLNNRPSATSDLFHADFVPPLHVAVASGSTHAASCLLRMGADPSLRPVLGNGKDHLRKYHDRTAWELAFATDHGDPDAANANKKGWFGFGGSPKAAAEPPNGGEPLDVSPSKLEGIRNAFTAEALRAIGGDEVDRLLQLLDSGLSLQIEIGGRTLLGWSKEMNAVNCLAELQQRHDQLQQSQQDDVQPNQQRRELSDAPSDDLASSDISAHSDESSPLEAHSAPDQPPPPSPLQVAQNRRNHDETDRVLEIKLEETNALVSALSATLDSLAEEVSVTQGLLLNDGSSSWLISHVRSLKTTRAQREDEVDEWNSKLQPVELLLVDLETTLGDYASPEDEREAENEDPRQDLSSRMDEVNDADTNEVFDVKDRLMASEQEVRKLRASIADLAEERERNIVEVERLGLTGAVKLARSLREEVRDLDASVEQLKTSYDRMNSRVQRLRARQQQLLQEGASALTSPGALTNGGSHRAIQPVHPESDATQPLCTEVGSKSTGPATTTLISRGLDLGGDAKSNSGEREDHVENEGHREYEEGGDNDDVQEPSDAVSRGLSTDIMLRTEGSRGYLPLDLWELIRRIVGLGRDTLRRTTRSFGGSGTSIMIV